MSNPEETAFPTKKERFEDRRKEAYQRKVQDEFFDHATLLAVSRLVSQGEFEALDYPISTGKEGGVFRASGPSGFRAVKIYRVGNAVFRRLPQYAMQELMREASARNFARLVFAWTRREHTILRKLSSAGVRCPTPYGFLRNVLVMEFIGTDGLPAAPLQESIVADPAALHADLLAQMRTMVERANLVHGDLSPYNILMHEGRAVFIDVAQAVPADHPEARRLMERDLKNFARYFRHLGVRTSWQEMFTASAGERLGSKGGG
jgi:RIO kinase 1